MDIRIIENTSKVECRPLDDKHILLIHREKITTSVGTSFVPFSRIYYYIYNVDTNVRQELLPDVVKYEVAAFSFAESYCPYVYFFTVDFDQYPEGIFHLKRYHVANMTCTEVITVEDSLKAYVLKKQLHVFVLSSDYCIFQYGIIKELADGFSGYFSFQSELIDLNTRVHYPISEKRLQQFGLSQMTPIVDNVCAVHFGWSLKDHQLYEHFSKETAPLEQICLISISQLISDLIIGVEKCSCEIVDSACFFETFSSIAKQGKYLLFTKYNLKDGSSKIIYYQYITKEPTVLMCKPDADNKPNKGFILQQRPFVARYTLKHLELLDIKAAEVTLRLSPDSAVEAVFYDYIVLKTTKRSLLSTQKTYEIYQYPAFQLVSKVKAEHVECVSLTKTDINLITYGE